ncbi:MAG: NERD domain-containing protein [Kiritimatiellae bacterium]|nr:NERD domain-containing protein [Kiritimatiellia bacterium]
MASIHGVAGEWARVKGTVLGLWPLFAGVFAAGCSAAYAFCDPAVGGALFVVAAVWCAVSLARGLRHVERYFKGARGEERVAGILQKLPDGYHVFNDFVACGRHVDHVVVGSGGVFAVETKFWLGRVTLEDGHILLDGQLTDRPPLRQVLKEAEAVRNELAKRGWRGEVTPVLAFASDTFEAKIAESGGVVIINSNALETSFASVRTVLPPAELDRLVRLMENG